MTAPKINVDIAIDDSRTGSYSLKLNIDGESYDLDAQTAAGLMADLASGTSLILSQENITTLPSKRKPKPDTRWHREETSRYVAQLPTGHEARVFKGDRGWVAVLGDEVLTDVVSSKRAAVEEVEKAAQERSAVSA